jgi:DNA-binding GntR family transcriptional regulator
VGSALLQIERLYFASSGEAVELSIGHYRPDQYSYRIALRGAT